MSARVPPDVVDLSRSGRLVHAATSSGRTVTVVGYIEGVQGDPTRCTIESQIICRTSEQAAEVARVLREARIPPRPKLRPAPPRDAAWAAGVRAGIEAAIGSVRDERLEDPPGNEEDRAYAAAIEHAEAAIRALDPAAIAQEVKP